MKELIHDGTRLLFRRQTHILSAAFVIMITFAASHFVGLIKTRLLISYFFGSAAQLLDVYYAAFVLPDTIFQLLVIGSLSAAFIPVFAKYLSRDEKTAWEIAGSSLNIVLLVFTIIAFFMAIFSYPLSRLIAPGFSQTQLNLLSQLLRVMLVAQLFFCVSGFLTATIQSHQRFLIPALSPLFYNLGIIAGTYFLSSSLGIFGPALGAVLGAAIHMGIQLPLAMKLGFRPSLAIKLSHPGVREIIRLAPPRALAQGVDQAEHLVTVILASTLTSGSLSLLNVARLLYSIPVSLFGVTIGQAALPTLSRQSDEDKREFSKTFADSLLQIIFLVLPVSALFIVLRIPIVRIAFGAKTFPWFATLITGKILAILSASAVFAAAHAFISRGFYALHDTRTPLKIGLIAAVLGSVSAVIAVHYLNWGLLGLAGIISLTAVLETTALFTVFVHRLSLEADATRQFITRLSIPVAKMLITTIVTGFSLWVPMRLLDRFVFDTTRTIPLLALTCITSVIGFLAYLFLSYLFRVEELQSFITLFKRVKNWRLQPPLSQKMPEPLIPPVEDQN